MFKVSLILYITIGIGLLLFLYLSPNSTHQPHSSRRHGRAHRRLKLRSNFTFTDQDHHDPQHELRRHHHDPVAFDPMIAEIERHHEDKQWERMHFEEIAEIARNYDHQRHEEDAHHHHHQQRQHEEDAHHQHDHQHNHHDYNSQHHQPEWEDFDNAEDYLNDDDKFNVTGRIVLLFPQIDVDPADGFVSEKELTRWNFDQAMREVMHRSQREMEVHDKNRDGFVSLAEYEPPSWVKISDNNTFGYDMGWWKQDHFNASDMNEDGLLNITEFNDFLHPADTKNPKLLLWLCKEEIRERDTDKDGKINFNEFFHGLFDLVWNYEEEGNHSAHHSDNSTDSHAARNVFDQLDKDGDGLLTDAELLPIIGKLHPSELHYATQQSAHVISQADIDKDGRLSLAEMVENPYVFYSSIFTDEDDYNSDYHDEFR